MFIHEKGGLNRTANVYTQERRTKQDSQCLYMRKEEHSLSCLFLLSHGYTFAVLFTPPFSCINIGCPVYSSFLVHKHWLSCLFLISRVYTLAVLFSPPF
jgi:hypothetical protein